MDDYCALGYTFSFWARLYHLLTSHNSTAVVFITIHSIHCRPSTRLSIIYLSTQHIVNYLAGFIHIRASQVAQQGKKSISSAGDMSLIPGSGRSLGGGHGNPLQYSCLENSVDRGVWWATIYRIVNSWTWLKQLSISIHESESESLSVVSNSLQPYRYSPWNSLGQNRILSGVDFPFFRVSSQPRDWTQVSHIASGFFTNSSTRKAQEYWSG